MKSATNYYAGKLGGARHRPLRFFFGGSKTLLGACMLCDKDVIETIRREMTEEEWIDKLNETLAYIFGTAPFNATSAKFLIELGADQFEKDGDVREFGLLEEKNVELFSSWAVYKALFLNMSEVEERLKVSKNLFSVLKLDKKNIKFYFPTLDRLLTIYFSPLTRKEMMRQDNFDSFRKEIKSAAKKITTPLNKYFPKDLTHLIVQFL